MSNIEYFNEFKKQNESNPYISIIDVILAKEQELGNVIDWDRKSIIKFFIDMHYTGISTVYMTYSLFKSFIVYICDKNNLKFDASKYEIDSHDLIDINKFLATSFTPLQIKRILNQLDKNVRDRVIIELADNCLGTDQIRNLKISDIEFKKNKDDMEMAFLTVKDEETDENQRFKIEDGRTIEDIHSCINISEYYIVSSDGRRKKFYLKDSPYLIRPVNVGRGSKDGRVSVISVTLKSALKNNDVYIEGIDIDDITVENIKRSKLIYMLSPSLIRKGQSSREFVTSLIGNKRSTTPILYFYEEMARIKYPDNKK